MGEITKDNMKSNMGMIIQFAVRFQVIDVTMIIIVKAHDLKYNENIKRNMKMITQMTT